MEDTQRDAFHRGDQRGLGTGRARGHRPDSGDVAAAGQGHAPGAARAVRTRPVARVRPRRASRSSAVRSSAGWIPSAVSVIEASPGGIGASAVRAGVGPVRPAISRIQASGSRVGTDRNNTVWTSAVRVSAGWVRPAVSASNAGARAAKPGWPRAELAERQAPNGSAPNGSVTAGSGPAEAARLDRARPRQPRPNRPRPRLGKRTDPGPRRSNGRPSRPTRGCPPARRTGGELRSGRRALVAVWLRKVAAVTIGDPVKPLPKSL